MWKGSPATRWLLLVTAVAAHACLTLYSFLMLFGSAHMHPDDRPVVARALWQGVLFLTWFPLMLLADLIRIGDVRLLATRWGLVAVVLNSAVVVLGVRLGLRALRRRARRPDLEA